MTETEINAASLALYGAVLYSASDTRVVIEFPNMQRAVEWRSIYAVGRVTAYPPAGRRLSTPRSVLLSVK